MKIISRLPEDEVQLQRLRDILEAATNGAIGPGGDLEPETTLTGLVGQVDITCISLLEAIEVIEKDNIRLGNICIASQVSLAALRNIFTEGVTYDEDLDHATIDFMESMLGSGIAESTPDGEIIICGDTVLSKSDIKPFIKEAITSWLRLKSQ